MSTQDMVQGTKDMGHGTQDTGHGTRDVGHRTQDMGHGTRDTGHGMRDAAMGQGTRDAPSAQQKSVALMEQEQNLGCFNAANPFWHTNNSSPPRPEFKVGVQ